MTFFVDVKEIHDAVVRIQAPPDTPRDQLLDLAQTKFEEEGAEDTEYNRTLEMSEWTIRDENDCFI